MPVLEAALDNPHKVSILMYPTKALAQDQLRAIAQYTQTGLTRAVRDHARNSRM